MIKIKQKSDMTYRNGDYWDDQRTKEVYLFGIKIFEFQWDLNRKKEEASKQNGIGFHKKD